MAQPFLCKIHYQQIATHFTLDMALNDRFICAYCLKENTLMDKNLVKPIQEISDWITDINYKVSKFLTQNDRKMKKIIKSFEQIQQTIQHDFLININQLPSLTYGQTNNLIKTIQIFEKCKGTFESEIQLDKFQQQFDNYFYTFLNQLENTYAFQPNFQYQMTSIDKINFELEQTILQLNNQIFQMKSEMETTLSLTQNQQNCIDNQLQVIQTLIQRNNNYIINQNDYDKKIRELEEQISQMKSNKLDYINKIRSLEEIITSQEKTIMQQELLLVKSQRHKTENFSYKR